MRRQRHELSIRIVLHPLADYHIQRHVLVSICDPHLQQLACRVERCILITSSQGSWQYITARSVLCSNISSESRSLCNHSRITMNRSNILSESAILTGNIC